MGQRENTGEASPISRPLTHCPTCNSTRLEPVVEEVTQDVHFLCRECSRCWDVALGTVTRVVPPSCLGCPERGRCEQVYAADHPSPRACIAPEGQPIG
jgi:transposase-like protein